MGNNSITHARPYNDTLVMPPRTPPERVRILRDAITAAYKDAEFFNEYKKLTGDAPSPSRPMNSMKS